MPPWKRLTAAQQEQLCSCPLADLPGACEKVGTPYASALLQRSQRLAAVAAGKTPILAPGAIHTGDALIISDVHLPRHDPDFSTQVLRLAAAWGLDTCISAGDLLDGNGVSPWAPELPSPTTGEELDAAEEFLARLLQQFQKVICLTGNHDAWLFRKALQLLGLTPERIHALVAGERVTWSTYHWGDVVSGGATLAHRASEKRERATRRGRQRPGRQIPL